MDNSIYIALSRQLGLFQNMEMTANNIANVSTPGYNAQRMQFSQYLVKDTNGLKDAYGDNPTSYRDTSTGSIKMTGNPFDLAISGPGYFQVQTPLGNRYTKAGNFQINSEGTLVNNAGYPVLGLDGGQITVPAGGKNVAINGTGQVNIDGEDLGQVGVFEFANEQSMVRQGGTYYTSKDSAQPAEISRVTQGAIESSNVQPVTEMVKVMEISRTVADTAKFSETMYDLERKTSDAYTRSQTA